MFWLVEERPDIEAAFLDAIAAGEFEHVPVTAADMARMAELVRTYADLPLGAVDASVIAIAERLAGPMWRPWTAATSPSFGPSTHKP